LNLGGGDFSAYSPWQQPELLGATASAPAASAYGGVDYGKLKIFKFILETHLIFVGQSQGYGAQNQAYGAGSQSQGYGAQNQAYGAGSQSQGYGAQNQAYGAGSQSQGYGAQSQDYGAGSQSQGYGSQSQNYGGSGYQSQGLGGNYQKFNLIF
jgi:hypothetical protein